MNKFFDNKQEKVKYCKTLAIVNIIVITLFILYIVTSILLSLYLKYDNTNFLVGFGYSAPILLIFIPFLILCIFMHINNFKNWTHEIKNLDIDQKTEEIKVYKILKWWPLYILLIWRKYAKIKSKG